MPFNEIMIRRKTNSVSGVEIGSASFDSASVLPARQSRQGRMLYDPYSLLCMVAEIIYGGKKAPFNEIMKQRTTNSLSGVGIFWRLQRNYETTKLWKIACRSTQVSGAELKVGGWCLYFAYSWSPPLLRPLIYMFIHYHTEPT